MSQLLLAWENTKIIKLVPQVRHLARLRAMRLAPRVGFNPSFSLLRPAIVSQVFTLLNYLAFARASKSLIVYLTLTFLTPLPGPYSRTVRCWHPRSQCHGVWRGGGSRGCCCSRPKGGQGAQPLPQFGRGEARPRCQGTSPRPRDWSPCPRRGRGRSQQRPHLKTKHRLKERKKPA